MKDRWKYVISFISINEKKRIIKKAKEKKHFLTE